MLVCVPPHSNSYRKEGRCLNKRLPKQGADKEVTVIPASIREYAAVRERYGRATKKERGRLLDEFCQVTGYHRKAEVRVLRAGTTVTRRRGRPVTYSAAVIAGLEQVWEASDRLCSKRLVGVLPDLMDALERHGELALDPAVRAALVRMSPATIDRRLAPKRRILGRRPFTQSRSTAGSRRWCPCGPSASGPMWRRAVARLTSLPIAARPPRTSTWPPLCSSTSPPVGRTSRSSGEKITCMSGVSCTLLGSGSPCPCANSIRTTVASF